MSATPPSGFHMAAETNSIMARRPRITALSRQRGCPRTCDPRNAPAKLNILVTTLFHIEAMNERIRPRLPQPERTKLVVLSLLMRAAAARQDMRRRSNNRFAAAMMCGVLGGAWASMVVPTAAHAAAAAISPVKQARLQTRIDTAARLASQPASAAAFAADDRRDRARPSASKAAIHPLSGSAFAQRFAASTSAERAPSLSRLLARPSEVSLASGFGPRPATPPDDRHFHSQARVQLASLSASTPADQQSVSLHVASGSAVQSLVGEQKAEVLADLPDHIVAPSFRPATQVPRAEPASRLERSAPILAYARPDNPAAEEEAGPKPALIPWPGLGGKKRTAIYDISAGVVHMPNGEKLEAHSGRGAMRDNPKYVHVKMRGSTPPSTYRLSMREKRFHGVDAIRLTPVNGIAPHGRVGLLAHTYLLRVPGDSSGCIVFKDYRRFLAAFRRGAIDQIIVVPRLKDAPALSASAPRLVALSRSR